MGRDRLLAWLAAALAALGLIAGLVWQLSAGSEDSVVGPAEAMGDAGPSARPLASSLPVAPDAGGPVEPAAFAMSESDPTPAGLGVVEVEVVDEAGKPPAACPVELFEEHEAGPAARATATAGRVRFAARVGSYFAAAAGPDLVGETEIFPVAAGQVARQRLVVRAAVRVDAVGHLFEYPSKAPIAGARVALRPDDGSAEKDPPEARAARPPVAEAVSDAKGIVRFPGLLEGVYRASTVAAGYDTEEDQLVFVAPGDTEFEITLLPAPIVDGRVVDAAGAPVEGAEVTLLDVYRPERSAVTRSDRSGGFAITVHGGNYLVTARKGDRVARLPRAVAVYEKERASGLVLTLRAAASLSGTVLDGATGGPLPEAAIAVADPDSEGVVARAATGLDGRYAIPDLPAGVYRVTATAAGATPAVRENVGLTEGGRAQVDFTLTAPGAIEGSVSDAAGRPVPGVPVSLAGDGADEGGATTATDDGGRYHLSPVPAGEATVVASSAERSFHASGSVRVPAGGVAHLDLKAGGLATLAGHVTEGGQPLSRAATVTCKADDGGRWSAPTGRDGAYRLPVPPGDCLISVSDSEVGVLAMDLKAGEERTLDLDTARKEQVVVVAGDVVGPDGAPARFAQVEARREQGSPWDSAPSALSDEEGRFTVLAESWDAPGPLLVEARSGGRLVRVRGVAPGTRSLRLTLGESAALEGRILSRARLDKFHVVVSGLAGSPAREEEDFAGDGFAFPDLPPGRARVLVTTPSNSAGEALVELTAGATARVTISLRESGAVSGRAVDATSRQPVDGCTALVRSQSAESVDAQVEAGGDGRFRLEPLAAGDYLVRVECEAANAYGLRSFSLEPGRSLDLGDVPVTGPPPGRIGIIIAERDGVVTASEVDPTGPAAQAGILAGDSVLSVDGTPVHSTVEAMMRLRGPVGSSVRLTTGRAEQTFSHDLVRASLPEPQ